MTARLPSTLCLFVLPTLLIGCGKDCQSTCNKLYGTTPNCGDPFGTEVYGLLGSQTRGEKMSDCMTACEDALAVPGKLGDYDPYTRQQNRGQEDLPELKNDRQVALWMECVAETSCQNLKDGICAPVW
jgi:hypothetical protein